MKSEKISQTSRDSSAESKIKNPCVLKGYVSGD
jgi:hypothetical protein